jgi:hypothetical protein
MQELKMQPIHNFCPNAIRLSENLGLREDRFLRRLDVHLSESFANHTLNGKRLGRDDQCTVSPALNSVNGKAVLLLKFHG